jgi:phosphatidylethanolamine-binding protein (PEBP) family uncharacterized protein
MCVAPSGAGGGVATGGASSGGATSGGAPAAGGASSGGAPPTGGASSGGMSSGGESTAGGSDSGGGDSGGSDTGGVDGGGGLDGSGGMEGGGEFTLTSAELTEGAAYPDAHTCAGGGGELGFGVAPSLAWSGFPAETMSFALTMIDITLVDGPSQSYLGCHSAFWNLPVSETTLPLGDWSEVVTGTDNIRGGYLGPCPGGNLDTYEITLYAMPAATIPSPGNMGNLDSCNMLRQALDDASIAKVVLTGTSDAQ